MPPYCATQWILWRILEPYANDLCSRRWESGAWKISAWGNWKPFQVLAAGWQSAFTNTWRRAGHLRIDLVDGGTLDADAGSSKIPLGPPHESSSPAPATVFPAPLRTHPGLQGRSHGRRKRRRPLAHERSHARHEQGDQPVS